MEQRFHCIIKLLDEQVESINVEFQKDTKGQYLLDQACDALRLAEREYFGLRYVDSVKQRHWLDCDKKVLKQLKGTGPPYRVVFRVKFYPAEPHSLKEEITRFQIFQQLKRDLLHGRLVCSFQEEALLGACIVQSNLEDYNPEEHLPGYVTYFTMFPRQSEKLQIRIEELHQSEMRGLKPAEAEFKFIETAHKFDTYGVDPHLARDMYGTQLYIGLTFRGLLLFRGSQLVQTFKWDTIRKFTPDGRAFIVHAVSGEKKVNHRYWLGTELAANHLWKCAVENQGFFQQGKAASGLRRSNSFLRRNRFSFSGSTQREALENSSHLERPEPAVARSPPLVRPRRSLQINSLRPTSDASTFEGFTAQLMGVNHSTPIRESDIFPPIFTLAASDTEDETSSMDTQPQPSVSVTDTDSVNPIRDVIPEVVEEEEIVEEKNKEVMCESAAPSTTHITKLENNNHTDKIVSDHTPKRLDSKDVETTPSHAYSLILLLLLFIITITLIIFVLFETDLPLVRPVQESWLIHEVKYHYYEPGKAWIAGRWRDFEGAFITPASRYVTSQVDTIITRFRN